MKLTESTILITGGTGFVGTHLKSVLKSYGAQKIHAPSSKEYDLTSETATFHLFEKTKPDYVFALAARVGGILDNRDHPADFYRTNILIGSHTFEASKRYGVKKLINLGAGCGYPLRAPEPLKEESIWDGFPQPESAPYSLAKKMLILQGIAYRKQYGLKSITLIPSNIYGEYDNYHLEHSHVIPALVRKFYEATRFKKPSIEVWGDGTAKRDFIHALDVAQGLVLAGIHYDDEIPLNLALGRQYTIREVVEVLQNISGFQGKIEWRTDRPSGQKSREFSTERVKQRLPEFKPELDLPSGLRRTYQWLSTNYDSEKVRL